MKLKIAVATLAITAGALFVTAQDAGGERRQGPGGPGEGRGGGRMTMPLMTALDPNSDGEIDATEIANATAALKKLDKNGDGKLTREELRPEGGRGRGPGGPGGEGGERRRGEGGKAPGE